MQLRKNRLILRIISLLLTVITLFVMAAPAAAFIIAVIETTEAEPQNEEEIILTAEGPDYTIKVACGPEAEIPADAVLSVREVEDWKVGEEEIPSRHELAFSCAFDISILNAEGEKIQPKSDVRVSIDLPEANDAETIQVLHYADEEEPLSVEEELSPEEEELPVEKGAESLRGLKRGIDTSDLQFGKQSLRGESAGLLSVSPDEQENSDGVVVTHSDGEELPAEEEERHTDEEAEQTVEEPSVGEPLDATVEDGIVSFSTGSFSIFAVIGLRTLEKQIVASDGRTYDITVSFGPEAGIPDGAELEVTEILPDGFEADDYDAYLTRARDALAVEELPYARFFDISIVDAFGGEVQPVEGTTVNVQISLADAKSDALQVLHFGEEIEFIDSVVDGGTVLFEASGFSVYAIVDAPEPVEQDIITVKNLAELAEIGDSEAFLLSMNRNNQETYFINIMNNKNAFSTTTEITSASDWFFEPVDSQENKYRIYTTKDGQNQYIKRAASNPGNDAELTGSVSDATIFTVLLETEDRFYIKDSNATKYLQYSNSGGGIRFHENKNMNGQIALTYSSTMSIPNDPYNLDGKTFGIAYHDNSVTAAAMMAESTTGNNNQQCLVSLDMLMKPDVLNHNGILLVAQNSEIQEWSFESIEKDLYYITTIVDGTKKYLSINGSSVTLEEEPDSTQSVIKAIPGTGEQTGKWHFVVNSNALNFSGNVFNGTTSGGATWLNLVERSVLNDDDFTPYTAKKVSVSDAVNVYDGQQVIIYTRVWNDTTKKYEFYAIDYNGALIPCYADGDTIEWIGSNINTALWTFKEGRDQNGELTHYYWLQNAQYPSDHIVPNSETENLGGAIYHSEMNPDQQDFNCSVNLDGRRKGRNYTTIVAWDDERYSFSGLKTEDGRIVGGPLSEAEDFYFAVMTLETPSGETGELTTVNTLDGTEHGITMKMVNFTNKKTGNTISPRDSVQNPFFGGDNNRAGLLSTNLGDNGYPTTTSLTNTSLTINEGKSLSELFTDMTEVNHLFIESIYNESGYIEYGSTSNFAHLNDDGTFTVYDQLGAIGDYDGYDSNHVFLPTGKHGQFLPYNDLTPGVYCDHKNESDVFAQPLSDFDPRKGETLYSVGNRANKEVIYHFGMEMEAQFTQTVSGLDDWGHDIIFEFSGDDDFWFYVDGELVLDLGGVHSAMTGSINFRTGEVKSSRGNSTLYDIFRRNYLSRGMSEAEAAAELSNKFEQKNVDGKNVYVFKDYTQHDMKMFYMERGAGASNLYMRFNLASVKSGTVELSKKLSGTESESNKLIEFPYQIWYRTQNEDSTGSEPFVLLGSSPNEKDFVKYKDMTTSVKYKESLGTYQHVFFLKAGETAVIDFPDVAHDERIEYYVVECGVNTDAYDHVKVNDGEISGQETNSTNRKDYKITPKTIEARPQVIFDNHVKENAMRTLSIKKNLYDSDGETLLNYPDNTTLFTFRLYLGNEYEASNNIPLADLYHYFVKDTDLYYCEWDSQNQRFKRINGEINTYEGLSTYLESLSPSERENIVFNTSMNGSISKIPAGYTVEIRDLIIGTQWKVEEKDSDIPKGYTLRLEDGYVRTDCNPEQNNGIQPISGTMDASSEPSVEVSNQKGWGLTVQKVWTDEDFVNHDPIYFAVYYEKEGQNPVLLEETVDALMGGSNEIYYFFDQVQMAEKNFSEFKVYEVLLENPRVDYRTDRILYDNITRIMPNETTTVGGRLKGNTSQHNEYDYTVIYQQGLQTTHNENVRTDIVTNFRPGIKIHKTKWNEMDPLAGAVFTLKDQQGHDVVAEKYISREEDGLVTVAYLDDGDYTLKEIETPKGYVALDHPILIHVDGNNITVSGEDTLLYSFTEQGGYLPNSDTTTDMPTITIRNRTMEFNVKKVNVEDGGPLEYAHFALYLQVTDSDGNKVKDYLPLSGYDDLITDNLGILTRICLDNLNWGYTYYLTETEAPEGFELMEGDLCFTIGVDGTVTINNTEYTNWLGTKMNNDTGEVSYTITIPNGKMKKVSIWKTTPTGTTIATGAIFELYLAIDYDDDNKRPKEGKSPILLPNGNKTNTDGILYLGELDLGEYRLVETQAPDGYNRLENAIKITVGSEGVTALQGTANLPVCSSDDPEWVGGQEHGTYQIRVSNNPGIEIPSTGGKGILPYLLIGGMLVTASVAGILLNRKKTRFLQSSGDERMH